MDSAMEVPLSELLSLSGLRNQLSPDQQLVLNLTWKHFQQNNTGIPIAALYQHLAKDALDTAINGLGGSIIHEITNGRKRYSLTFLGCLLTDEGERIEGLIVDFLRFLRARLASDTELNQVTSQDVEVSMGINRDDSILLGQVIRLSPFASGGSSGKDFWTIGLPQEADDLIIINDLTSYVRSRAVLSFDRNVPVSGSDRYRYLMSKRATSNELQPDEEFEKLINLADEYDKLENAIINRYQDLVTHAHPAETAFWPVLSGYSYSVRRFGDWFVLIFEHTGRKGHVEFSHAGEFTPEELGVSTIDDRNLNSVRQTIETRLRLKATDAVLLLRHDRTMDSELVSMLQKHELSMGLLPLKIFLSHTGADKPLVRQFKGTLSYLGFDPWMDEDVVAGMEVERAILQGFKDSCAAVFFVTPRFKDENYLRTEVNYAIDQRRLKGERFAIITLVFEEDGQKGDIPELLKYYVWKEPKSPLEALRAILEALPVKLGEVSWRDR
jgi:TIR domain